MIEKILWSFVAVAVVYTAAIFLAPEKADELATIFGIESFNTSIRELKSSTSEDVSLPKNLQDINSGSGFLDTTQELINSARSSVENLKDSVGSGKVLLDAKVEQAKKIGDSAQKAAESISQLKKDIATGISDSGSPGVPSGTPKTSSLWSGTTASWVVKTSTGTKAPSGK